MIYSDHIGSIQILGKDVKRPKFLFWQTSSSVNLYKMFKNPLDEPISVRWSGVSDSPEKIALSHERSKFSFVHLFFSHMFFGLERFFPSTWKCHVMSVDVFLWYHMALLQLLYVKVCVCTQRNDKRRFISKNFKIYS